MDLAGRVQVRNDDERRARIGRDGIEHLLEGFQTPADDPMPTMGKSAMPSLASRGLASQAEALERACDPSGAAAMLSQPDSGVAWSSVFT